MPDHIPIPVIDLFSGPGGLGEGFASLKGGKAFRILVSAEMNSAAHETLRLRAYFRKIRFNSKLVQAYYDFCNGKTDTPWNSITKKHWDAAGEEALQLTLGTPQGNKLLDKAIKERLPEGINCVLIGGPPCQAYSLVGRARNKGKADYRPEDDHRHFLYKEYLRVIQRIKPAVFVMENVKGILSSRVNGVRIFHEILRDLSDPEAALSNHKRPGKGGYRIHSLTCDTVFDSSRGPEEISPADFVVRAESHGIPQARHRVILVGVRDDIVVSPEPLQQKSGTTVAKAINDMPRLRSRISKGEDSSKNWKDVVSAHCRELAVESARCDLGTVAKVLQEATRKMSQNLVTGGIRYPLSATKNHPELSALQTTLRDPKLSVVLNHEARGHMLSDLRRYAYVAAFTAATGFSPKGHAQFQLSGLRPNHANWESGKFSDRFRAQGWENPSSTITSHISKDGHYFIHPDVAQCRSLTVREAARLQTFPDNYFFQGNRTEQFHQVGNAVPPLLATMIAQRVASLLRSLRSY